MIINEWKDRLLQSGRRAAIPVMTHPGLMITGRTVREAVTNADVHAQAVKTIVRRYPVSAAVIMMDLSIEAEAFGARIRFEDNEVPTVMERIVTDADSVEHLVVPPTSAARVGQRLTALRECVYSIIDRPVFAECIGPFSLAGRLFDVSEMMMALYDQPETIHALLEKCTAYLIACCKEFKQAGAHGVIVAEPVAGMLSPDHCEEFSSQYVRRMVNALQDERFMLILHNCGDTENLVPSMVGTGAAGLHFGNRCSIVSALSRIPGHILVGGNLDPVSVLKMGTCAQVEEAARQLLETTAAYPNFVLSSGCDIPPSTPVENIDAFFSALDMFNGSR